MRRLSTPPSDDIRYWLHQAIDVIEVCSGSETKSARGALSTMGTSLQRDATVVRECLVRLCQTDAERRYSALVHATLDLAVNCQSPTVWFARSCDPLVAAVLLFCSAAQVPWERAVRGHLKESDFPPLTVAAHRLAQSPIRLYHGQDARNAPALLREHCIVVRPRFAIFDWTPDPGELCRLERDSEDLGISILIPQTRLR